MLAKGSAASSSSQFDLPEEVLEVLPSDPFKQLDVARKITSIALSSRVSALESDSAALSDKDRLFAALQTQLRSHRASLSDASDRLSQAQHEKENLLKENASLSNTVKKLNRDVSKLEAFRKTLMRSLQEDEDSPARSAEHVTKQMPTQMQLSLASAATEEDATLPPSGSSSIQSHFSESGNSYAGGHDKDATRPSISPNKLLASEASTPWFTPPGSPPSLSGAVTPMKTSNPVSPRWHSVSYTTTRGMFDDRPSIYSSLPSSLHSSISSSDTGSQTAGRARVDGKEFFLQVRSRLSYEQFGAFLANVKELNSHNRTREVTLVKAEEIFGPDNNDLYVIFERLIARNVR